MLQNLKTNARLIAKEKWYEWRLQLTAGVQQQIQAMNVSLKEVRSLPLKTTASLIRA